MRTQMAYSLFTSTKFDPFLENLKFNNDLSGNACSFFLLSYHLDRLRDAVQNHGWERSLTYDEVSSKCKSAVQEYRKAGLPCRIRLILDKSGTLTTSTFHTEAFSRDPTMPSCINPNVDDLLLFDPIVSVYLDTQPTPSSIFTSTKTTLRGHYENARTRAGLPALPSQQSSDRDVLLYNSQQQLTESSICNVAFWRSKWITPPTSTGCLPGVVRRWLLEQGRIAEAEENVLTTDSVHEGDWILLMNGVIGCKIGKLMARPNDL